MQFNGHCFTKMVRNVLEWHGLSSSLSMNDLSAGRVCRVPKLYHWRLFILLFQFVKKISSSIPISSTTRTINIQKENVWMNGVYRRQGWYTISVLNFTGKTFVVYQNIIGYNSCGLISMRHIIDKHVNLEIWFQVCL